MKRILFDLDGTLTDPHEGITQCIRYAMDKMQRDCPEELSWCIGPPLQDTFKQLLQAQATEEVDQAVRLFRERFSEKGMFENRVYDGVMDMLTQLKGKGFSLYIATSKPKFFADQILKHFQLANHFVEIFGSELNGIRTDKGELISYALEQIGGHKSEYVMIGDRKHDLIGAQKNSISAIGVLWGYGSSDELKGFPHLSLQQSPTALTDFLLQHHC